MDEVSVSVRLKKKLNSLFTHTLMKYAAHVCADISCLVAGPKVRYCCTFTEIFLSYFEMTSQLCCSITCVVYS